MLPISLPKYSIFFLILVFSTTSFAQLNIKVGYGIGFTNPALTNTILQDFNTLNNLTTDPLNDINHLHGIIAGLRYRMNDIAIEATVNNKLNSLRSTGTDIDGNDFFRDVFVRYGSYGLGLEGYLTENFGLGASFDLDNVRFRTEVTDIEKRYKVFSAWGYSSQFHLSFYLRGNDILTLSLKPYVQIPWSRINVAPLNTELNAIPPENTPTAEDKFLNFGIQLIFYNGIF